MQKGQSSTKLGIIKTYKKKMDQYNAMGKEVDSALLMDKEALDLHLSIIDLFTACAKNSPYGIA